MKNRAETDVAKELAANTNTVRGQCMDRSITTAVLRKQTEKVRFFWSPKEVSDISDKCFVDCFYVYACLTCITVTFAEACVTTKELLRFKCFPKHVIFYAHKVSITVPVLI